MPLLESAHPLQSAITATLNPSPLWFTETERHNPETTNTSIKDPQNYEEDGVPRYLLLLKAVLLQLLALSLMMGFSGYSKASNTSDITSAATPYLLNKSSDSWLQIASIDDEKQPGLTSNAKLTKSSWAIAIDNDILAPGHRDRDYTYGLNLTYSGSEARDANISLKTPLAVIDELTGIEHLPESTRDNYSIETGIYAFTPKNITQREVNPNDRPYASLVYISSSHEQVDVADNVAWKTTLTLGVLGLGLAGELQNTVHKQLSGKEARGWNNQISDGGEFTGRYVIARQQYLEGLSESLEVKSTLQASVGYLTETSWSLSIRDGSILSPWASFNPELISYGEKSTYNNNTEPTQEHYFWAGFTFKARFYNAFLQGQFRDSALTYSYNDLKPVIVEGWAGYTFAFKNGYRFSYVLRGQTSEIKQGEGNRNLLWGGLILAQVL